MKSELYLDDVLLTYESGSIKMVCSSLALGLMLWTIIQFSSQAVMMAALDMSSAVKVPIMSIQTYINRKSEWPLAEIRFKRAVRKLPSIDNKEIEMTVEFAQGLVDKMARHESNIAGSNIKLQSGTADHGVFIESMPTTDAFQLHYEAMVALKASKYLASKHCVRLGIDDENCAKQISTLPLSPTPIGTKCNLRNVADAKCPEFNEYRSYDGTCNHKKHPAWGSALTAYRRILLPDYEDGLQKPRGSNFGTPIVNPRVVSTTIAADFDRPDTSKTLAAMQWGQFIAHDMSHTVVSKMLTNGATISCCASNGYKLSPRHLHPLCAPIEIPQNDKFYADYHQNCMSYVRSMAAMRSDCKFGPLEQMNQATHYLDGSVIYGSTPETAKSLRSFWQGRLRTSNHTSSAEYLPDETEFSLGCRKNSNCYKAGDPRVNIFPGLTALQTIWVREHNRLAQRLVVLNPHWSDERIYQETRKIVIAEMQHITYNEWLPVILGKKQIRENVALTPEVEGFSQRYKEDVDPAVSNSFATAAMRFINSMIEGRLGLYKEDRSPDATIFLKDLFHKPNFLEQDGHLDSLIRGMATQSSQNMDLSYSEAITNYFHKSENSPYGLDQLSLDIQRGRDHGIPGYNKFRKLCKLREAKSFSDLSDTMSQETITKMKQLYRKVDEIDLLIGGLAESHEDSLVGPTFRCIIADQFARTRSGDRYFYDNGGLSTSFTPAQLKEIKKTTLAKVFCENTENILNMQPFVFHKPASPSNDLVPCGEVSIIKSMDLEHWREEPIKTSPNN